MAGELPGGPDDRSGGDDGPVDRTRPRPADARREVTTPEQASIEQWISKRRMESAQRLGLSASDAERMEKDFDGDLRALVEWKRSRGEALPAVLEGFGEE